MRILLITDEVWNDKINGNNILSNWFDGFPAEISNIYCSPGMPVNQCCRKYFQITDAMMAKSIFTRQPAGRSFELTGGQEEAVSMIDITNKQKKFYAFMKSITTESLRAVREWLWIHGKYDEPALRNFVEETKPDIIFSPRYASRKILRLERVIYKYANVPMVAFTADDEYSLRQLRFSPVYWIRRLLLRKELRRNVNLYSKYYTFSEVQKEEYKRIFKLEVETLYKCGDFAETYTEKPVNTPMIMVYAGKLYCNRWKVLRDVGKVLAEINTDRTYVILNVYTRDKVNRRQLKAINDQKNIFLCPGVTETELKEIYAGADIALHVESSDLKNRLLTRYSFSTKIIDCLASTCAVFAICWEKQEGFRYLKEKDAAFCTENMRELKEALTGMIEHPELLQEYEKKAWRCGKRYHERKHAQEKLYADFNELIR